MTAPPANPSSPRPRSTSRLLATALCLVVAGCNALASPSPSASPTPSVVVPSAAPAHAEANDGRFQLSFELPRGSWPASEPIDGTASLSVSGAGGIDVSGSGQGLLGFNYDEVGGLGRHMDWVETADCRAYRLEPGQPVVSTLKKAGGYSPGSSVADFYASFFADPLVHLPPGDWTITAIASFISYASDQGCHLPAYNLSAPIVVHVTG